MVDADDRRIGTAFRRSLWIIGAAVLVVGVTVLVKHLPGHAKPVEEAAVEAPVAQPRPAAAIPPARFVDVTREAGITFVHHNGAYGEKLLPETMGGGVAFFDATGRGNADLLFVDSGDWPWKSAARRPSVALYLNDGHGHFRDATPGSGLESIHLYGMGVAIGDYDNDGLDDILITGVGDLRLLHNLGNGHFADVTRAAGITSDPQDWNTCAGFADVDNDGWLDLFVCRYVRWSRAIDRAIDFRMTGIGRAYGPPTTFEGSSPRLFHNSGHGSFVDISDKAGVRVLNPSTHKPIAKSLGLLPIDVNGDGWIDFVVSNDTTRNFLFLNRHGTFEEIGARSGIAYDVNGNARGAMGIDGANWRNDAQLGIAIGNFANEMAAFYVGGGDSPQFDDEAIVTGIGPATRRALTFGVLFIDYDLDGRPDLFQANGHIESEINKVQSSQEYAQPMQLFWNCGDACAQQYAEVPKAQRGDLARPIVGRGAAYADIDGDGDTDLVVTQIGGPPLLLRNDQTEGNHWLRVRLEGSGKVNRDAIGSEVRLTCGGITQHKMVMPTRSYLSQVERPLTFGLGKTTRIDKLEVRWTDGTVEEVPVPEIDRVIQIRKRPL
jgi:hypothetical protein